MSYQDPQQQPGQSQGQSWGQPGYGSAPGYGQPQDYVPPSQGYQGYGVPQPAPQQYFAPQQTPLPDYGYGQPQQNFAPPQDQSYGQPQQYFGQQQPPGYGPQPYGPPQQGYSPQNDFGSGAGFGGGYPGPSTPGNSGLATAALWLGIFGGWGLINLIVSIIAITETGPGKKNGRGKALTGLCLTLVWSAIWAGLIFAVISHTKTVNNISPSP